METPYPVSSPMWAFIQAVSKAGMAAAVVNGVATAPASVTASGTVSGAMGSFNNLAISGTATGITKAMVGLSNVDNTSDANKPVSTAQAAAIAAVAFDPMSPGNFGGTTPNNGAFMNLEVFDAVSFPNQSLIVSTLNQSGASPGNVLTWNGTNWAPAAPSGGSFNPAIPGAIGGTTPAAGSFTNLTVTGTATGITKTMVGLGNVDNTSDANKPVSTAQAAAIAAVQAYAEGTATDLVGLEGMVLSHDTAIGALYAGAFNAAEPVAIGTTTPNAATFTDLTVNGEVNLNVRSIVPSTLSQGGASTGHILRWDGTNWAPAAPSGGSFDPSNPGVLGGSIPAEGFFTELAADEATLGNLYVSGSLSIPAHSIPPSGIAQGGADPGDVLVWDGGNWIPNPPSGGSFNPAIPGEIGGTTPAAGTFTDLNADTAYFADAGIDAFTLGSGTVTTLTVTGTLTIPDDSVPLTKLSQAAASTGQVIMWTGTQWEPQEPPGAGSLESPGPIGGTTPSTAAFTDLNVSDSVVLPSLSVALSALATGGAAENDVLTFNGTTWATAAPPAGGGPSYITPPLVTMADSRGVRGDKCWDPTEVALYEKVQHTPSHVWVRHNVTNA